MLELEDPVDEVRGVGPKRAAALARGGIDSVEDLLLHLPFRYEDRGTVRRVAELAAGEAATLRIRVASCRRVGGRGRGRRRGRFEAVAEDPSGRVRLVWFHQPYLADSIATGDRLLVHGRASTYKGKLQLANPSFAEDVGGNGDGDGDGAAGGAADAAPDGKEVPLHVGRIVPIYRRVGPLGPARLRRLVAAALDELGPVDSRVPRGARRRLGLVDKRAALRGVHLPGDDADLEALQRRRSAAHRSLVCEEFLAFQTALLLQRPGRLRGQGRAFPVGKEQEALLDRLLPFELTRGQRRALQAILADLESDRPMHRLLQGDVGSGKTAVAACAMAVVASHGVQAALLAPTEILARQHADTLGRWARRLGLEVACVTGRGPDPEAVDAAVESGRAGLVVGTHALLEPGLRFARLGLAVVDEQHRFGVRQRAALRDKGRSEGRWPDLLVMSATPIPRSLALTAYGDLEACAIDDLPPGRVPVETEVVSPGDWPAVAGEIEERALEGLQAYVVAPRIGADEAVEDDDAGLRADETVAADAELRSAVALRDELERRLPELSVGLLHGGLDADDKEATMAAFVAGDIDVLAATTVVEVGVDVADAVLMVVEHAERFGLAQLHQLRGRVGRGNAPGRCVLVAHEPVTETARRRLRALVETHDGFVLAETDLELRGPGEVFGTRQTGVPTLRIGDLEADRDWLVEAREAAEEVLRALDADEPEARRYLEQVRRYWRRRFTWVRSG